MRILFGPEDDHRQTPFPAPPGAYEWWYFDALSSDGRYAVVAIFFLGSPMTPYYKAVVDGKKPDPMDWCGVFFTLHEKIGETWNERAYAYNLYRGGEFSAERPEADIGDSTMTFDGDETWTLSVQERGLWNQSVKAELRFSLKGAPLRLPAFGTEETEARHTWVCVAPLCRVQATIGGTTFQGQGYHDHNFGLLPYDEIETWYWVYAPLKCSDGKDRFCLLYYLPETMTPWDGVLLLLDDEGTVLTQPQETDIMLAGPRRGRYGFTYCRELEWKSGSGGTNPQFYGAARLKAFEGSFSEGPFYVRLPAHIHAAESSNGEVVWTGHGEGIGEVFRPFRLCGPIASRAMWSRIRRRNRP
ncbi:MAG: hypothetical protein V4671_16975 [Armatimonadota bacterium]